MPARGTADPPTGAEEGRGTSANSRVASLPAQRASCRGRLTPSGADRIRLRFSAVRSKNEPATRLRRVAGSLLSFTDRPPSLGHGGQVHLLRVADQLHLARAVIHRQAVEVQV